MRRNFERFARFAFALLLGAGPGVASARTAHETIAYVPAAIWGDYLVPATAGLTLTPHAIYWFEGDDSSMGRVLGDLERYQADDAKAAPREPMVAFVGRYAAYPSNTLAPGVAVMDTTGALIADFPRGRSYAWSPDGTRLVVLFPKEPLPRGRAARAASAAGRVKAATRYRPGISVWDRRDGSVRSFARWPSRAAWAGNDSLLLQFQDSVLVLDASTGKTDRTGHNGTIVSSDSRYALWPGEDGEDTRVFEEVSGQRITDAVFGPFQRSGKGQIRSAFWVRGRGAGHLMVVCGCDGIQFPEPSCRTRVIDVETLHSVASFRGEALGPTADERGVVVFRRDLGRLEYHDLRPLRDDQERREPPSDDSGSDSGEFY
ncbi:MAG TPA: hypothetical protein VL503_10300 [Candidatus Omnitrophota bacterium]|nr:hypothetical protein [Candidatus Omnitrophota bacterium]